MVTVATGASCPATGVIAEITQKPVKSVATRDILNPHGGSSVGAEVPPQNM
jgi:hypothetical protein